MNHTCMPVCLLARKMWENSWPLGGLEERPHAEWARLRRLLFSLQMNWLILCVVIVTSLIQIMSLGLYHGVACVFSRTSDRHLSSAGSSLVLFVPCSLACFRHDAWIVSEDQWLWAKFFSRGRYKLTLVVGAAIWRKLRKQGKDVPSVTNNNLRWVLVGHNDSWLRKTASVCVRVVGFKRFLRHSCMQNATRFVHFSANTIY